MRPTRVIAVGLAATVTLVACRNDGRDMKPPTEPLPAPTTTTTLVPPSEPVLTATPALRIVAPWTDGSPIPTRHTCDDIDVSPALSWGNVPLGTVELAITVTDADAAGFVHWIVTEIDPAIDSVSEDGVIDGSLEWPNDFDDLGWSGPCPPAGAGAHTYIFTVHALNQQLELADDSPASEVIATLNELATSQSSVSGIYTRAG